MGNAAPPHTGVYFPSLSARTVVYKGMLMSASSRRSTRTCATSGSRAP